MTTEAEVMKARLGAHPNGSTAAAMTADTRVATGPVHEIVMTLNTVHRAMLVVGKAQNQGISTPHEWLTQRQCCAAAQHCQQGNERDEDDGQHES